MINKKIVVTFFIFSLFININSAERINGDTNAAAETTFSFPVQAQAMSNFGTFYVGSHEELATNQNYALSRLVRKSQSFEPIAPETVIINGEADKPNPLFGAKINALSLLKPVNGTESPVVVTEKEPAVVYLVEKSSDIKNMNIVPSVQLKDANGLPSNGIVALETNVLSHVFAAVKPSIGTFGDNGSGIAMLIKGNIDNNTVFGEVDAATGMLSTHQKALLLDKTSALLTMNSTPLSAMGTTASFHWDEHLQRLFIGLDTTSNSGTTDAALAVVVGRLVENGGLELFPIAPPSAFAAGNRNNIVGIQNAPGITNQEVSIHTLTTLYTSTGLNYLIVVGGVVTDAEISQQTVYALPLVNNGEDTGTVAQKSSTPIDEFSAGDVPKLIARTITQQAITPEEMTLDTDSSALVGGGMLTAGSITQLIVRDDTVFVCVGNDITENNASGIYSSQALFDAAGTIKGWTNWQRAAGTTNMVFGGALNAFDGTFIFTTGTTLDTVDTVKQTVWSSGDPQGLLPVTTFLNSIFSPANGGIQSMETFLPSTPGLAEIALMTAGGIGTLALIQTGLLENNNIIPTNADDFNEIKIYENGTITDFVDSYMMSISGGALDAIGPITATTIASNGTDGWIFVGGSDGLAILSYPDGSGWDITQNELGNKFDGLNPNMSFKTIGNYIFVKKLLCDDNFLYVITNDRIDRINLITSDFATNTLESVTIATKETLTIVSPYGSILDAIISQAFALIATTGGLVRIADEHDVRTLTDNSSNSWKPIIIPEAAGAPTQLIGVSTTAREEDITRAIGGQIYVLTANEGYNQSRINRFTVEPLNATESMQSTTLQPFNDLFVENIPSFFINFGNFNSIFATDGALYFAARSQNNAQSPRVVLTPAIPAPQVASRNVGERSTTVPINFSHGTEINGFQRSQASGSWVAAGDFGMQVLE